MALPAAALTSAGLFYSLDNVLTGFQEVRDNQAYDLQTTRAIAALTNPEFARNAEIAFVLAGSVKGLWHLASWARALAKNADDLAAAGAKCMDDAPTALKPSDFPEVRTTISNKQLRHISGRDEYRGGGHLGSMDEAQEILDAYHCGDATILGKTTSGFPVVRYDAVTGTNVNISAGFPNQPTSVFIIKGTSSPSVVPTNPNWSPKQ